MNLAEKDFSSKVKGLVMALLATLDGKVRVEETEEADAYSASVDVFFGEEEIDEVCWDGANLTEAWGHLYVHLAAGDGLALIKDALRRSIDGVRCSYGSIMFLGDVMDPRGAAALKLPVGVLTGKGTVDVQPKAYLAATLSGADLDKLGEEHGLKRYQGFTSVETDDEYRASLEKHIAAKRVGKMDVAVANGDVKENLAKAFVPSKDEWFKVNPALQSPPQTLHDRITLSRGDELDKVGAELRFSRGFTSPAGRLETDAEYRQALFQKLAERQQLRCVDGR